VGSWIRNAEGDGLGWPPIAYKLLIAVLAEAYEHTLRKLNLVQRSDPVTQLIAKKIIEIGWS